MEEWVGGAEVMVRCVCLCYVLCVCERLWL